MSHLGLPRRSSESGDHRGVIAIDGDQSPRIEDQRAHVARGALANLETKPGGSSGELIGAQRAMLGLPGVEEISERLRAELNLRRLGEPA